MGEWDDDTIVNGDFTVNAKPNRSWVYSLVDRFPNLPKPPGGQDHVLGGKPVNAHLHLDFSAARKNVELYLLYQVGDDATEASIRTILKTKTSNSTQLNQLQAGWNKVTYVNGTNTFDISVDTPASNSNLLLAQVDYPPPQA